MSDDVETGAQLRHARVHRAGTAPACGACRDHVQGLPTGWRRVLTPRRPQRAGLLATAAIVGFCALVWAAVLPTVVYVAGWFASLGVFALAIRWFVLADRADRAHSPR